MTVYSTSGRGGTYSCATQSVTRLAIIGYASGPVCTLTMRGRLDADSVIALDTQLEQLASDRFEEIVVDIRELHGIDASGRAGLDRLAAQAEQRGTRLRVVGTQIAAVVKHPGAEAGGIDCHTG
jgi:anti-anti-sigma factor